MEKLIKEFRGQKLNRMKNKGFISFFGAGSHFTSTLIVSACLILSAVPAHISEARELSLGGITDSIEETVEQSVEESVQDRVDEATAEVVEETIVERTLSLGGVAVERTVEAALEENVEEAVEAGIEDAVEEIITGDVTAEIEEDVEETIAEEIEQTVTDLVEEGIEETFTASIEEDVAGDVEQGVTDHLEDTLESDVEEDVAENVEQGLDNGLETNLEQSVAGNVEEKLEGAIDEILDQIENEFEIDERRIQGQWLVMAEPEVFEELAQEGYLFDNVTELPGLGLRLAEVAAPSSFDISAVRQGVIDVVGSERAEVDLNHIYTAGEPQPSSVSENGIQPRAAIEFPADTDAMPLRIGMIDSRVDTSHPAFSHARIESRSFVPEGAELPDFHGTAIASILAATGTDYQGLAPSSQIYAAAVFQQDPERGEIASTVSLVRALDWLLSSNIEVVNISLAGPPNRLLEAALARAASSGVIILAAAGNGGPTAEPMYPAAYETVVAVTAVDSGGQVFRLANRGNYLDLSAPGVSMLHARAGGGYVASSGTSFAVPFAATAAARLRYLRPEENVIEQLIRTAEDLGPPGRDEIYGYGLLHPANS